MKQYLFILSLFCFVLSIQANEDWGRTGHRATGEIAEQYLTKKAKKNLDKLLKGESLALVSNYADDIKSDRAFSKYYPWHYVSFPFDATYESHPKNEDGDIIQAIETCISILKDETASEDDKVFHLKLLIHFMGDLHQPLHIGLAEDKGGNDIQVRWFNDGTNIHSVWDTKMIESYNMSYTELANTKVNLTDAEIKAIQSGTLMDWVYDSRALCKTLYNEELKPGAKLGYRYMYDNMDTVRLQLHKGGIRLAEVLNDIFG